MRLMLSDSSIEEEKELLILMRFDLSVPAGRKNIWTDELRYLR